MAKLQANVQQAQNDTTEIKGDVKTIKATVETLVINQTKMDGVFVTQAQYKSDKDAQKKNDSIRNTLAFVLGVILTGLVSLVIYLLVGAH